MRDGPFVVLIVEDDPDELLLLRRAMKKALLDQPIRIVHDGEEAIAYLEGRGEYADRTRHPLPMLMVLDLKLPRRSGIEVLRWLRVQPALRRLPVVVMTTSRMPVDIDQAYEAGANSYVVKPVVFEAFLKMLRTLNDYWQLNERPRLRQA